MSLTIQSVELLKRYIDGVMERANHHALGVNEIALTLAGAVVWKATEDIRVRTYNDEPANMLWFQVEENTYCFVYNHHTGQIDLKERNGNGAVLASFDNSDNANRVKTIFDGL